MGSLPQGLPLFVPPLLAARCTTRMANTRAILVRGTTSQLTFRIVGADEIAVVFEAQDPRPHPDAALPDFRILQPRSPVVISDCRNES